MTALGVITAAMRIIYPPQCLLCEERVQKEGALCPSCRSEVPFSVGLSCDACGQPLAGESDQEERCDDCLKTPRIWERGRAVMAYKGKARDLLLGLKHADRTEVARPAGVWMAGAMRDLVSEDTILAPMPLHRKRLRKRGYNQSALLATSIAKELSLEHIPNLLFRNRYTKPLEGHTRDERIAALDGAIGHNEKHSVKGRHVVVVDDVMTTGASLSAATTALLSAGVGAVDVVVLARAGKET